MCMEVLGKRISLPPYPAELTFFDDRRHISLSFLLALRCREDKRSRRYRDRDLAKFERSRRYRHRYRC